MPRRTDAKPAKRETGSTTVAKKSRGRPKKKPGQNLTEQNLARRAEERERLTAAAANTPSHVLEEEFWFGKTPAPYVSELCGYSRGLAAEMCGYISQGVSLRRLCTLRLSPLQEWRRPSYSMVNRWLAAYPEFDKAYQRALAMAADVFAAEIVEIADSGCAVVPVIARDKETGAILYEEDGQPKMTTMVRSLDSDVVAHNKLRIEARKWYAAKMAPRRYGERITNEHTSPPDAPVLISPMQLRHLNDTDLAQLEQLMKKTLKTEE